VVVHEVTYYLLSTQVVGVHFYCHILFPIINNNGRRRIKFALSLLITISTLRKSDSLRVFLTK